MRGRKVKEFTAIEINHRVLTQTLNRTEVRHDLFVDLKLKLARAQKSDTATSLLGDRFVRKVRRRQAGADLTNLQIRSRGGGAGVAEADASSVLLATGKPSADISFRSHRST
jgi:hypothetical protein